MIALLASEHYLAPIQPWNGGAHFTHLARVDFDGEVASAFVKIYRPGTGGIIGEALGYLASVHLEAPRPPHAAVLPVPLNRLAGLEAPAWLDECGDTAWAWCSEQLNGPTLAQYYRPTHAQDPVYAALLRGKAGAQIAAIDETLSNGDRNSGNLIRTSARTWAVIDHGECLGSHLWPTTGPYDCGTAELLKKAETLLDAEARRALHSGTIVAAQQLAQIIPQWQPLIHDLLQELGLGPQGAAVMPFLQPRQVPEWIVKRLSWLL